MSTKIQIAPERGGASFAIALRVLGAIALLQTALVLWVVIFRFDGRPTPPPAPEIAGFPAPATPSIDPVAPAVPTLPSYPVPPSALPAAGVIQMEPGTLPGSVADGQNWETLTDSGLPDLPAATTSSAHRIDDPGADSLVNAGLDLRSRGDTAGALGKLREANRRASGHPKILAEIATTYDQMGQRDKAAEYWEQVHAMGIEGAGAYWDYANMFFDGETMETPDLENSSLRISRATAHPDRQAADGERWNLRIHLQALNNQRVIAEDMLLEVFFFDLVNGRELKQTIADTNYRYVTAPYDWKNGEEEIIEVEYFLPKLSNEQIADHGRRRYLGYVVELYYQDVLQDVVAEPRKLSRLGSAPKAPPPLGGGLFP